MYVQLNCLELIKGRFNFLFKDDAKWGEKEIIRFRWILITVIFLFIGYRYMSGMKEWAKMVAPLAGYFALNNLLLCSLIRKFKRALWIGYLSTTIDITLLSVYIYLFTLMNSTAISSSATILLYPILIMFSVLRYNGSLVAYSTLLSIAAYNFIYFLVEPSISKEMVNQVVANDWAGQVYRSTYFALIGYFMFSIPKMTDRLISKQIDVIKEHNETELKLALEKQKRNMAISQLDRERDLNDKLNEQSDLIQEQKKKLEDANNTKDKLFAIVGHDLRSPLSVQCSLTELLETDYDNLSKEEILEIIAAISKSAHQGIGLLSNLLDWATSENNDDDFIPGPVSILKIVSEAIALFHNNAKYKNIKITTSLEDDLTLCVDGNMLETIIRNLLSNAIKFSPKGNDVEIEALKRGTEVWIYVKDNGIGMTKKQIAGLFKISRDSSPGTEDEPGAGVGLMLCKELVEKNNGSIEVQSSPNQGTVFTVKLPVFSQSSVN